MKAKTNLLFVCVLCVPHFAPAATLINFDFSSVYKLNSNSPITSTTIYNPNLKPIGSGAATGLALGSYTGLSNPPDAEVEVGELAWDGNYGNSPGVNTNDQTLAEALANNRFISFTIEPQDGYQLDMAGGTLTTNWYIQFGGQSPENLALFTSVGGFSSEADAIQSFDNFGPNDSYTQVLFTLPSTAAFDGITNPFEIRVYFYDGLFGGKLSKVNQMTLTGDVVALIPEPSRASLLGLAGAILLLRCRRKS